MPTTQPVPTRQKTNPARHVCGLEVSHLQGKDSHNQPSLSSMVHTANGSPSSWLSSAFVEKVSVPATSLASRVVQRSADLLTRAQQQNTLATAAHTTSTAAPVHAH